MDGGKVAALHISTASGKPMTALQEATAVADQGLEGDRHALKGSPRQVLLMDIETLKDFELVPGQIKENITVEGLDLSPVKPGQVFFLGDQVTLEATGLCEPCSRMDMIRPGLQQSLDERRRVLAMVLNGGTIKVGDQVTIEPSRQALVAEASRQESNDA